MKGIIKTLPDGSKPGRIEKIDKSSAKVRLRQQDLDAAAGVISLTIGTEVAFDEEEKAGFPYAVNLRDPKTEIDAANAEHVQTTPEPPPISEPVEHARLSDQQTQTPSEPAASTLPAQELSAQRSKPPETSARNRSSAPSVEARGCNHHQATHDLPGKRNTTPAPYTFVRIQTQDNTVAAEMDVPVFHDGKSEGERLSGELHIEITSLTPLLPGQHRYEWTKLRTPSGDQLLNADFSPAKKILEPAIIDRQNEAPTIVPPGTAIDRETWKTQRIIIPATSIKGPIRQAVAAILNAPMERVAERHLSYRPNVDTSTLQQPRYKPFAGVVQQLNPDGSAAIKVLRDLTSVIFVERPKTTDQNQEAAILRPFPTERLQRPDPRFRPIPGERFEIRKEQNELESSFLISNYRQPQGQHNGRTFWLGRLEYSPRDSWTTDQPYKVCHYACGIDGAFGMATLTRAQHERKAARGESDGGEMTARHYVRALVPSAANKYFPGLKEIGPDLIRQRAALLRELVDSKTGHLSRLPRSFWGENLDDVQVDVAQRRMGEWIERNHIKPYQVIYFEATVDTNGNPDEILSYGTHFRYRWRYSSSVREINIDPRTGHGTIRPVLRPAQGEAINSPDDNYQAGQLTGARLLFGYVADKQTATETIGEKSFSRLAGRIAINHAIEEVNPDAWEPEHRFLHFDTAQGDARFLLPMRILGTPKTSAVEHYIQQKDLEQGPGATVTFGDVYGDPGGELNGRKFYRHQSTVRIGASLNGRESFLAEDESTCRSDQATLARLVSRPGTRYRLTLRFRDLRPWELGALLVVTEPDLLAEMPEAKLPAPIISLIRSARSISSQRSDSPLFALKMGYGRPLGFGSVKMVTQEALTLRDFPQLQRQADLLGWKHTMIEAFLGQIRGREAALLDWLQVSKYAGQPQADYPRDDDGEIFGYHTKIRTCHAKKRRNQGPMNLPENQCPQPPDRRIRPGNTRGE